MKFSTVAVFVAASVPAVYSQVTGVVSANCAGKKFTVEDVQTAADAALKQLVAGTTLGKDSYPHQEDDREGFTWDGACKAPYYEFPVVAGGAYSGGNPGADRVVIGSVSGNSAVYCDMVYHNSESNSNFGQCSSAKASNATRRATPVIENRGFDAARFQPTKIGAIAGPSGTNGTIPSNTTVPAAGRRRLHFSVPYFLRDSQK